MLGIYQIRNLVNGKIYIGSAVNINKRWNLHKSHLRRRAHDNCYLQRAWDKYGEAAFKFEILANMLYRENLINVEQFYLNHYRVTDRKIGYNIQACAGSSLGRPISNENKKKTSERMRGNRYGVGFKSRLGKTFTPEQREKMRIALLGHTHTEESKAKMSAARKGEKNSFYGKKHSAETKEKMVGAWKIRKLKL